jgi:Auxiliary Activity family 9 (formerly GH61)
VKLAESGYNSGTWAVDTLIANAGKHSFTLPSALAPGNYLIRPEIIALHEADAAYNVNPARGAQFYMECVQLQVTGAGSTVRLSSPHELLGWSLDSWPDRTSDTSYRCSHSRSIRLHRPRSCVQSIRLLHILHHSRTTGMESREWWVNRQLPRK